MKNSLVKSLAIGALGIIGANGVTTHIGEVMAISGNEIVQTATPSENQRSQRVTIEALIEKPAIQIENTYRAHEFYYGNPGIPPKEYGMYYAKRKIKS